MRIAVPIALAVSLVACHAGLGTGSERRSIGDFAYRVSIGTREPVDGIITIAADTVFLEADGQPCRRESILTGSLRSHPFSCFPPPGLNSFSLSIDSSQPAMSSWSVVQTVRKTREICVRYTTTARGTRVCAEVRSEDYFEDVRFGGRIRITRADTSLRL